MKDALSEPSPSGGDAISLDDDPFIVVRGLFENLLLTLISVDNARSSLRFKYVSPEWIGRPGWYFWPKSRPGVYFLRLDTACPEGGLWDASFALYYYPHPKEDVFERYSFDEQLTRVSAVFSQEKPEGGCGCLCAGEPHAGHFADLHDGIGLPVPEVREELNAWLFHIGGVALRWDGERLRRCGIEAVNRSRTWACRDVTLTDEDGHAHTVLRRGEPDRDVPAWELCTAFIGDFLAGLRLLEIDHAVEEERLDAAEDVFRKRTFRLRHGASP